MDKKLFEVRKNLQKTSKCVYIKSSRPISDVKELTFTKGEYPNIKILLYLCLTSCLESEKLKDNRTSIPQESFTKNTKHQLIKSNLYINITF